MLVEGTAEQVTALFQSLIQAQAEFPPIPKTKSAYNYKYAPLHEIHEKIRPILVKHGLAVVHPVERSMDGKHTVGTAIVHAQGGRMECRGIHVPEGIKIQEQGSYVTYGSRYGYCAMLGISSQDEDDAVLAAKSPRQKAARRDAVAQTEEHRSTPSVPTVHQEASGDSGAIPDPSLPTKKERVEYVTKLGLYRKQVTDEALQQFLLRESGASEVRLIQKTDWQKMLAKLDEALAKGNLLEAVSANYNR